MTLSSGNVTLINRRAENIYKEFNIKTKCFCTINYGEINYKSNGIDYLYKEIRDIKNYILEKKPLKIIFYGTGTFKYIESIKKLISRNKLKIKLFIDCQGALEEQYEYSKGIEFLMNYTKFILKKKLLKNAIKNCDGAIVVSDEMKQYLFSYMNKNKKEKFNIIKIRCGVDRVLLTSEKLKSRNLIREKWEIKENTVVMVFSGYRMAWQNIDKIIDLFKKYDEKYDDIFFAFFCNIDEEFIEKLNINFPKKNYELKFLEKSEYFEYLTACDVGFLVRDYNKTNDVAFPNKFSDYINSGLMIAINDALPEPSRLLKENNILYLDIEKDTIEQGIKKIQERQKKIQNFYIKNEKMCKLELLYSDQIKRINFN